MSPTQTSVIVTQRLDEVRLYRPKMIIEHLPFGMEARGCHDNVYMVVRGCHDNVYMVIRGCHCGQDIKMECRLFESNSK